jgi:hypothetical protein
MPDMLTVPARQIGDPVAVLILMETDDGLFHNPLSGSIHSMISVMIFYFSSQRDADEASLCLPIDFQYHSTVAFDLTEFSRWKSRLKARDAPLATEPHPPGPAEGILATCRLSDDVRRFALAGERYDHPTASLSELEQRLYDFRLKWEHLAPRIRISKPSSTLNND